MRSLIRCAVLLITLATCGSAAVADGERIGPTSLIAGRWLGMTQIAPTCGDVAPGDLCFNILVKPKLGRIRTLSGPKVAPDIRPIIWTHGGYISTVWMVFAVWREGPRREWHGRRLGSSFPGEPICLEKDQMAELKIARPAGSWRNEDDQICFRIK